MGPELRPLSALQLGHFVRRGNANPCRTIVVVGRMHERELDYLVKEHAGCTVFLMDDDIDRLHMGMTKDTHGSTVLPFVIPGLQPAGIQLQLNLANQSPDLVVVQYALERYDDPVQALSEFRQMVAPAKGALYIRCRAAVAHDGVHRLFELRNLAISCMSVEDQSERVPLSELHPQAELLRGTDLEVPYEGSFGVTEMMEMLASAGLAFSGWAPTAENVKLQTIREAMPKLQWWAMTMRAAVEVAHLHYGDIADLAFYAGANDEEVSYASSGSVWPVFASSDIRAALFTAVQIFRQQRSNASDGASAYDRGARVYACDAHVPSLWLSEAMCDVFTDCFPFESVLRRWSVSRRATQNRRDADHLMQLLIENGYVRLTRTPDAAAIAALFESVAVPVGVPVQARPVYDPEMPVVIGQVVEEMGVESEESDESDESNMSD